MDQPEDVVVAPPDDPLPVEVEAPEEEPVPGAVAREPADEVVVEEPCEGAEEAAGAGIWSQPPCI